MLSSISKYYSEKISWELNATNFILLMTFFNAALFHYSFFSFFISNSEVYTLNGLSLFILLLAIVSIFTLTTLYIVALFNQRLLKIYSIIIFLMNSIALYFINNFQVILDRTMMGNVYNTRFEEAIELFHPMLILYVFMLGVVPSVIIYKIEIIKVKRIALVKYLVVSLITSSTIVYINSSNWLWIDKHAKNLGGRIMPWSYVINSARYFSDKAKKNITYKLLPDAKFKKKNKMVVVLIIGEAAREENFSLYNYHRKTNPLLEKINITTFKNTVACATYTTASLDCILSHEANNSAYEHLPSYLKRHDVDVIWRTRNWGEPNISVDEYDNSKTLKNKCSGLKCNYDELLLTGLSERILSSKKQQVFVVLHTKGSHGPAYYTRYPQQFEFFEPTCKSVDLNSCTAQELVNAYDNSILYTDYFIKETIDLLDKLDDTPTLLLYISDHGESLGEYGLYLHGTPYSIAPDQQKKIPFLLWGSKSFLDFKKVDLKNLAEKNSYSQGNIFHTVMGAYEMDSEIYLKEKDVLKNTMLE